MAQERGDYVLEEGKELALVLGGALSWLHVHVNDAPIGKRDHGEMGATGVEGVAPPRGRLNSSHSPHGVPTGARDEHHGGSTVPAARTATAPLTAAALAQAIRIEAGISQRKWSTPRWPQQGEPG